MSGLESSIVDVLCLILNSIERRRNPSTPKRMFFSTNVYMALEKAPTNSSKGFKMVMDLERERFFPPILRENHFFVLCYDFEAKKLVVLDNRLPEENPTVNYRRCAKAMNLRRTTHRDISWTPSRELETRLRI